MKEQKSVLRWVLFAIGAVAFAVVPRLLMPESLIVTWRGNFVSFVVELIYVAIALPLAMNSVNIKNADSFFAGGGVYFVGAIIFSVISAVMCVVVICSRISLKAAIAVEIIAVFIIAVYYYLAYSSASHIRKTAEQDADKRETVLQLRKKSSELSLKINASFASNDELLEKVNTLSEGFRYLSPSEDKEAVRLEFEMLGKIDNLLSSNFMCENRADINIVNKQLEDIEMLYRMRKSIYCGGES